MSDSLQPHGLQHAGPPCPSLSPGVCWDSCPLSQWCCLIIPVAKTRQRLSKKKKKKTTGQYFWWIIYKIPQQNISKLNSVIYKMDHTLKKGTWKGACHHNYQENANQNHKEVSPYLTTVRMAIIKKWDNKCP